MTNLPFNGRFRCTCEFGKKGSWAAGYHTGIDLVGDDSTMYATCDGIVTAVATDKSYGNYIKIREDGSNRIHLFAHLKSFNVKVGQRVSRTTKIGIMGNTGNSTGTHLHYEIRKTDKYGDVINPTEHLRIPNKVGTYNSADYQIDKPQPTPTPQPEPKPITNVYEDVVFDPGFYAGNYKDLYTQMYNHFINNGIKEGRQASPVFDVKYYKNKYDDLKSMSNVEAYNHFVTHGIKEGRMASAQFNVKAYIKNYADLKNLSHEQAFNHYMLSGRKEGRDKLL